MDRGLDVRRVFATARIGVGLLAWLAPRTTAVVFGIDPDRSDRWTTRLFGARELALGVALMATDGPVRRATIDAGIVIDSMDAVAGFDELRRRSIGRWTLASGVLGAIFFSALGALTRRAEVEASGLELGQG